ncbi:DUF6578 domain-containing protein [Streptomyces triticiradicis]|uniref:Uncharacterized protein n=1 Tax=Streptomyces triticiradicis TaxID=2651189 RepID=A0A7J5D6X2_9ACTN|nr:DUF6578 domain-containing protein [Streptomyces triticiradicis]KAB1980480.1 hypothetical protein F8144_33660 [Streptomyces triticiradicis]
MGLWRVFYADWQMECCGTPFSVGDEVSWPLLLDEGGEALGGGWSGEIGEITATVEHVRDDGAEIRVLRADDGLVVALGADPEDDVPSDGVSSGGDGVRPGPGRRVTRSGLLTVERHGARWPETTGTVRTIHLVHQDFAEITPGSHTREPVPASRSSEAVDRCPKWFGEGRVGVLAELHVPGPRP